LTSLTFATVLFHNRSFLLLILYFKWQGFPCQALPEPVLAVKGGYYIPDVSGAETKVLFIVHGCGKLNPCHYAVFPIRQHVNDRAILQQANLDRSFSVQVACPVTFSSGTTKWQPKETSKHLSLSVSFASVSWEIPIYMSS
jgi:hypothetical protein